MQIVSALLLLGSALGVQAYDDLSLLSDEFDTPDSIPAWSRIFQTEGWGADPLADMHVNEAGELVLVPHTSSWYAEWRGELTYKSVSGDFVITTDVTPRARNLSGPPSSLYSLAGIMVRTLRSMTSPDQWTPQGQNYVFLSLGAADSPGSYQFEVKTTINSGSTLHITPGVPNAEIQVARIGSHFIMLRRNAGGAWQVHRRYFRSDMPPTLQAGLTVYTDWSRCEAVGYAFHNTHVLTNGTPLPGGGTLSGCNPDLHAAFDFVRFQRPNVPESLAGANFSDPSSVSDAELLTFLGSNGHSPGGASTPPTLTSLSEEPGEVVLRMTLQPDRSYRLQATPDFGSWSTVATFTSTSVEREERLQTSPERSFYRLVSP